MSFARLLRRTEDPGLLAWRSESSTASPLVKSLLQGAKDVAKLFSGQGGKGLGRVVAVEIQGVQLVGFVTQESQPA